MYGKLNEAHQRDNDAGSRFPNGIMPAEHEGIFRGMPVTQLANEFDPSLHDLYPETEISEMLSKMGTCLQEEDSAYCQGKRDLLSSDVYVLIRIPRKDPYGIK